MESKFLGVGSEVANHTDLGAISLQDGRVGQVLCGLEFGHFAQIQITGQYWEVDLIKEGYQTLNPLIEFVVS